MSRRLALLAVLSLPTVAAAQFSASARLTPLRPDRTPLAAAAELPELFLLGIDGATPIFVNPARAASANHRFVYGTIRRPDQEFGSGVPISFEGLFGTRNRRWLVSLENTTASVSSTNEFVLSTADQPVVGTTDEQNLFRKTDSDRIETRARVLLIGRTDFGGYAFGLFGGYRTDQRHQLIENDTRRVTDQVLGPTLRIQTDRRQSDALSHNGTDDYGIGVEAAFAGKRWDLAASLSFQGRTTSVDEEESLQDDHKIAETTEGQPPLSTLNRLIRENVRTADASPTGVDFELLGTIRSGLSRGDYLFGLVTGTVASGSADVNTEEFREETVRVEIGSVPSVETTTMEDASAFSRDLNTWGGRVSLGYVYAYERRGFIVLAGVNPSAFVLHTDFVNSSTSAPFRGTLAETDELSIHLDLPLHVQAPVSRRLALFGGGLYRYTFTSFDSSQRPFRDDDATIPTTIEEFQSGSSDAFFSTARLYGGALLALRSGLTAQAAFRGDLAAFSGWTVSLGYRF